MEEIGALTAQITKVQSVRGGGARITLDISEKDAKLVSRLLEISMSSQPFASVGFIKFDNNKGKPNG